MVVAALVPAAVVAAAVCGGARGLGAGGLGLCRRERRLRDGGRGGRYRVGGGLSGSGRPLRRSSGVLVLAFRNGGPGHLVIEDAGKAGRS